jgi:hypothetical protein
VDETGADVGLATAVLVDSQEGLFATNAHVIAAGEKFEIRLGSEWHLVESQEQWVDWNADLAIVQLTNGPRPLPRAVTFGEIPIVGSSTFTRGYTVDKGRVKEGRDSFIVSRSVKGSIVELESGWNISIESKITLIELVVEIALSQQPVWDCSDDARASYEKGGISKLDLYILVRAACSWEELSRGVSNEQKHLFYRNYIQISRLNGEGEYAGGFSGSPLLNEEEQLLGILSSSNGGLALIVSVGEIETLMGKVKR